MVWAVALAFFRKTKRAWEETKAGGTGSGVALGRSRAHIAEHGELHVVVTDCGHGIWEWEICRQGQPLPARMRDGPFKSHDAALAAGKIALREFVDLLESQPER
jgi:hypothetical protein